MACSHAQNQTPETCGFRTLTEANITQRSGRGDLTVPLPMQTPKTPSPGLIMNAGDSTAGKSLTP